MKKPYKPEAHLVRVLGFTRWVFSIEGHGEVTETPRRERALRLSKWLAEELVSELQEGKYKVVRDKS